VKEKKINNDRWVIRLEKGEKIVEKLKEFCKVNSLSGGFFFGLGAVDCVEVAHYDLYEKKYSKLKFNKPLELLNITGSIGVGKELIIHAHVTLSDNKMHAFGGHLVEAVVSGTLEIYFIKLPALKKKYNPQTGLNLLDL
jgi:hypothetical protein